MDQLPNNLSSWEVDEAVIIEVARVGVKLLVEHGQTSQQEPLRRRPPLERDRVGAHNRLMQDYFVERPFDLERGFPYFKQREDARHKLGFSPIQKCTSAIRQLAYGTSQDSWDEYLKMSEKASLDSFHNFCEGVAGANNDITVIEQSPVFDDIIDGVAPGSSFYANDVEYKYGYYLTDGIYPELATLVKEFSCPSEEKRIYFKKKQESARKDIERAFGVLKKRWCINSQPAQIWMKERLRNIMYTCLILHNMILEDSGKAICQEYDNDIQPVTALLSAEEKRANLQNIKNRDTHDNLRADLVEHLWNNHIINGNDDESNDEENEDYYD
ncbi:uncharacterized protein LOC143544680 [Bidens hawaiensis]|uniref:uncharacterized protein LOC143544680 n=1 Tax=Bidens hawaiensis TaxID=980011 RepID=UPI00404937D6